MILKLGSSAPLPSPSPFPHFRSSSCAARFCYRLRTFHASSSSTRLIPSSLKSSLVNNQNLPESLELGKFSRVYQAIDLPESLVIDKSTQNTSSVLSSQKSLPDSLDLGESTQRQTSIGSTEQTPHGSGPQSSTHKPPTQMPHGAGSSIQQPTTMAYPPSYAPRGPGTDPFAQKATQNAPNVVIRGFVPHEHTTRSSNLNPFVLVPPSIMARAPRTKPSARPSIPPGFEHVVRNPNTALQNNAVGPILSSGTGTSLDAGQSNYYQLFQSDALANAYIQPNQMADQVYQTLMSQVQPQIADLDKNLVALKKQTNLQGGQLNWLREDLKDYEISQTKIQSLELCARGLNEINVQFRQELDNVKKENLELKETNLELKEELCALKDTMKKVMIGGAVVGAVGLASAILAIFK